MQAPGRSSGRAFLRPRRRRAGRKGLQSGRPCPLSTAPGFTAPGFTAPGFTAAGPLPLGAIGRSRGCACSSSAACSTPSCSRWWSGGRWPRWSAFLARLDGWSARRVREEDYPILVPTPESGTVGRVIAGLSWTEIDRVQFFEGDEYDLSPVTGRGAWAGCGDRVGRVAVARTSAGAGGRPSGPCPGRRRPMRRRCR